MIREREFHGLPGIPMLVTLLLVEAGFVWALAAMIRAESAVGIVLASVGLTLATFLMFGLFMVHPNQGKVLQLFGKYQGTAKVQGLRWANPLLMKKPVSL